MQKYEREIVELLEKLESEEADAPPRPIRRDYPPRLPRKRRTSVLHEMRRLLVRRAPDPGKMMAAGFGLIILAWLLPLVLPIGALSSWLRIAGVVLFLGAFIVGFMNNSRGVSQDKKWRGRSLEPDRPAWDDLRTRIEDSGQNFRRWFRRRP